MVTVSSSKVFSDTTVAVFGLGYIGSVTAACLAQIGRRVIGTDKDAYKVDCINSARAPFFEPGLEEIVRNAVREGRLKATVSTSEALAEADVALICVGTPSKKNGDLGLDQLTRVSEDIAEGSKNRTKDLIVAVRSTVFPGTCDDGVIPKFAGNPRVTVVSNPEFLREGIAVNDFMFPSLLVVGGHDSAAAARVAAIYDGLPVEACIVSLRTAEMIKYACNCFHAVKIAFSNEIGALSSELGVDGNEVMATLCRDEKLNISRAYLRPGFAFGGSCLPKDLRAITYRANRLDVKVPLLDAAISSNREHLTRATQALLDLGGQKIGIVGLAFKEDTDDLRESPVVEMVEHLIGKGGNLRIFDPHISLETIYGSNRDFLLNAIPHVSRLLEPDLAKLIAWADCLAIAQSPSKEVRAAVQDSGLPVLDLVSNAAAKLQPPVSTVA